MSDKKNQSAVAAVIGYPIKHSRSPLIHNRWLAEHGIAGSYVTCEVAPADLEARLVSLAAEGLKGINVTIPHKEAIFALALDPANDMDEAARTIGAVNTVVFRTNGSFLGINTDARGFIASLETAKTPWKTGPALVLGAGGAARAVVYGLIQAGVSQISVANRTLDRARSLAADMATSGVTLTPLAWEEIGIQMKETVLLVNATSLGLEGGAPLALDLSPLKPGALVTDIVYAPLETDLLKAAKARGHETVDGLGMLIHQARFAFEAWFGILPEASPELRAALEADLKR